MPRNVSGFANVCFLAERGVFCSKKVHVRIQNVVESDGIYDQPTYLFILVVAAE
jgi:hypothetical protein